MYPSFHTNAWLYEHLSPSLLLLWYDLLHKNEKEKHRPLSHSPFLCYEYLVIFVAGWISSRVYLFNFPPTYPSICIMIFIACILFVTRRTNESAAYSYFCFSRISSQSLNIYIKSLRTNCHTPLFFCIFLKPSWAINYLFCVISFRLVFRIFSTASRNFLTTPCPYANQKL